MNNDRYHTPYKWTKMSYDFVSDALERETTIGKKAHEDYQNFLKLSSDEQQRIKREATHKQLMQQYNNAKEMLDRSKRIMADKTSKPFAVNMARGQNQRAKNTLQNLRTSFKNENLPFPGASNEFVAVGPEGDKHIIPRDYMK